MEFSSYPKILYANVLLLDGEIINFKTGQHSWEDGKWNNNRQPIKLVIENEDKITSQTFSKVVKTIEENNSFFENEAKEFYKKFKIHEKYPKSSYKPY